MALPNSILFHWGRVTYICVGKLTINNSDNGLSPERRQTIIWTNAGILLIGTLGTNFSDIIIEIQTFSLKKYVWKCRLRNVVHFVPTSQCVKMLTWLFAIALNSYYRLGSTCPTHQWCEATTNSKVLLTDPAPAGGTWTFVLSLLTKTSQRSWEIVLRTTFKLFRKENKYWC